MKAYRNIRLVEGGKRIVKTHGFRFRVIGWRAGYPVVQPTNLPKRLMDKLPKMITLDRNFVEAK